ncbi:hypothetical protein A2U01_0095961, partial [Trifolium medium]|nr:hypothetical protein [Trifolium medium]
VVAVLA